MLHQHLHNPSKAQSGVVRRGIAGFGPDRLAHLSRVGESA